MDHGHPERLNPIHRRDDVAHREVGQRKRIARPSSTSVDADCYASGGHSRRFPGEGDRFIWSRAPQNDPDETPTARAVPGTEHVSGFAGPTAMR
jgi:hypothetical protein